MLDRMFDDESQFGEPLLDDEGNVFIDADPETFPVIPNFLRYGRCVEGESMPTALRSKVAAVADYFGLNVLAQECQPPDDETEERSVEYSFKSS